MECNIIYSLLERKCWAANVTDNLSNRRFWLEVDCIIQYSIWAQEYIVLPVRVEHFWVCPHIRVMMNDICKQEDHSSFLELNTLQHTVLIACARKSAVQQEIIKSLSVCACVCICECGCACSLYKMPCIYYFRLLFWALILPTYTGIVVYILSVSWITISRYGRSCEASYMDLS